MRRLTGACVALLVVVGCSKEDPAPQLAAAATASAPALTAEEQALVAQIHGATDKYKDVKVALAEGYMEDPSGMCVTAAEVGAPAEAGSMGIHYFRPDLLGVTNPTPPVSGTDGVIDVSKPEVLVYEPQADSTMQLVAAEYLVFQDAWTKAGNSAAPVLAGQTFKAMADDPATPLDEAHGFTPHHELHIWLDRDNPTGMFSEFNPAVTCQHAPAPAMGKM